MEWSSLNGGTNLTRIGKVAELLLRVLMIYSRHSDNCWKKYPCRELGRWTKWNIRTASVESIKFYRELRHRARYAIPQKRVHLPSSENDTNFWRGLRSCVAFNWSSLLQPQTKLLTKLVHSSVFIVEGCLRRDEICSCLTNSDEMPPLNLIISMLKSKWCWIEIKFFSANTCSDATSSLSSFSLCIHPFSRQRRSWTSANSVWLTIWQSYAVCPYVCVHCAVRCSPISFGGKPSQQIHEKWYNYIVGRREAQNERGMTRGE